MRKRNFISRGIFVGALACVLVPAFATAGLCSLVRGGRGWCKDNGCAKTGVHCVPILDSGYVVDCKCRKRGGRSVVVGANAEIPGGGYMFDGSVLMLGGVPVGDTYDYDSGTQNPGDPVVGAVLMVPDLLSTGLKTFDDGVFHFDYYAFENFSGDPLELVSDDLVVVSAAFDELAYIPSSQSWTVLLDLNRQYNNVIGSPTLQKIESIDQSDANAFPSVVLASADDALAQTNGFTTPHNGNLAPSVFGLDILFWCPGDWNGDGTINTLDVLAFLNDWAAGDEAADINGDEVVNTLDVLAFLNAWTAGCD